uniref:Uncharacterized protein n=1 Tax=Arundo donax TaxID=35708 RepID=A0A0A9DUC8_ARUDO
MWKRQRLICHALEPAFATTSGSTCSYQ